MRNNISKLQNRLSKTNRNHDQLSQLTMGLLAILVGIIAGLGAVVFRLMIGFIHNLLFLGKFSASYNANAHTHMNPWGIFVILVPVIGSICVVWLVKNFAPEAKGHGVPEVMDAIYLKQGKIRPIVAAVKAIASAISIGSGASVGREGPIVQIGSAFGSTLGMIIRMPSWQRGILIAAGAAAGIAATFNTPVGALLFGVEIMLASISAITIFPVSIAIVTASFVGAVFLGSFPAFYIPALSLPNFRLIPIYELISFIPFGILLGLLSLLFIRGIYWFEDSFEGLFKNYYIRHAVGMSIMGILFYFMMRYTGHYYVEGVGYSTIVDILRGLLNHPWLLLFLCFAKLFSTSITIGSGASGGIFSPALFIGATFGGFFGIMIKMLFPSISIDPTIFAIAGMAAMIGGSTGAVLTAIVMVTEMTHNYNMLLPIIISVAIAYAVRKKISNENIYTLKLLRRGNIVPEGLQSAVTLAQMASHVMSKTFRVVEYEELKEKQSLYQQNQWQNLTTIIADEDKIIGIWRYPLIQNQNKQGSLDAYIDKNFITVTQKTKLPTILSKVKRTKSLFTLVNTSHKQNKASNIVGVITEHEIAQSTLGIADLLH